MTKHLCRGCRKPLVDGDLRRGDNWHARCFTAVTEGRPGRARPPRRIKGLTSTQVIILEAAAASPAGTVVFARGDRRGTRVAKIDEMGRPWIIAYSYPAFFMEVRGLLAKANEPHVYRVTDKGRSLVTAEQPR